MSQETRPISLQLPRTLAFGCGCAVRCGDDAAGRGVRRAFVITGPSTRTVGQPVLAELRKRGVEVGIFDSISHEPMVEDFRQALSAARDFRADAIIGLGGGSPMDVAKVVAALLDGRHDIREAFGIGKVLGRSVWLACIATTAGTGSEVSPNAVLLDDSENLKKAVISPHLVPDAAYVDPMLTLSVPSAVTAATGVDALTHCIEAYANRFAHPLIDFYALEGIRLISRNLSRAVENGNDVQARTHMALGSMYGGMCLGPVNTAAVHALSYPLGSEFRVAHGVSNAVLLPHVMEFNLPVAPERYANVAVAMGIERDPDDRITAQRGLQFIRELSRQCKIPGSISLLGVPHSAIERMARSAMTVTRLLERNVREVTLGDAIDIYRRAF